MGFLEAQWAIFESTHDVEQLLFSIVASNP